MWQKLKRMESLAKGHSQQQNGINNKLAVLKEQQPATMASPKLWTWAAMAAIASNANTRPLFYNMNNKMVVKLNYSAQTEEIKKQTPEKVAHRINSYIVENNITAIKLRVAQTLLNREIAMETTDEKEAKKLKKEDGWTKRLGSKAKLVRKRYGIVALGILIAKIETEKAEEAKKRIVTQNVRIRIGIKIESIFLLPKSKRNRRTSSPIVQVADAKISNMLIEDGLVLNHILHGCIRYNPACRIKLCFKCYSYGHVSVHSTRKLQSAELVQALKERQSASGIKGRIARYIMVHTHCEINGVRIERKNTLEWKRQSKTDRACTELVQSPLIKEKKVQEK